MDNALEGADNGDEMLDMSEMADRVARGMAKWPDVPAVYNWLQLDRRGCWRMKGAEITHPRLLGFINQHYYAADDGSYYFQNGPQQVFVELALTPYVFSLPGKRLVTQNNLSVASVTAAYLSDQGDLYLQTDVGPGLVDDRYLAQVEEWFVADGDRDTALATLLSGNYSENTRLVSDSLKIDLPLQPITEAALPGKLKFIARPQAPEDGGDYCVD